MSHDVSLTIDERADVLYARRPGVPIRTSREAPGDSYLILNLDAGGNVVGVQLLAAHEMPADFWREHPDRGALPPDLLAALDRWMREQRR